MGKQRVAIVGAGAMGCFFAARLRECGTDATLIDVDDSRLAALSADGVSIADMLGRRVVSVAASRAAAVAGAVDLLVLFTKGVHTRAAVRSVAHLIGPHTRSLTLQNGIGNAEAIAEVMPAEHILVGVTDIPCELTGPTSISSHGLGHIWLGNFAGDDHPAATGAVALLRHAGLNAEHDPRVKVAIWEKIAFNASMNALCAITQLRVGELRSEPGRRLIGVLSREVILVAQAAGIPVDAASIQDKIDYALANHVDHKPSMLQDLLAGRATEIETINGAVENAGRAAGIATPANSTLADLIRMTEGARGASRGAAVAN